MPRHHTQHKADMGLVTPQELEQLRLLDRPVKPNKKAKARMAAAQTTQTTTIIPSSRKDTPMSKVTTKKARGNYAKTAARDEKGRILPKNATTMPKAAKVKPITDTQYDIFVLKGKDWVKRTTIITTPKGRPLKNEHDALRFGYGVFGTRPRKQTDGSVEATAKSGKRFRAVKVG